MLRRLIVFVPLIFFIACSSPPPLLDLNAAIQTLTATVWTATPIIPSATPRPRPVQIVDALNVALVGAADPLAETIGTSFRVIDAEVMTEPPNNLSAVLLIEMECHWVYSDSCTPEEAFIALMNAIRTNQEVKDRITENIPPTVHTLQMVSFNDMIREGMIIVAWQHVVDYMNENINGTQLGARIVRMPTP